VGRVEAVPIVEVFRHDICTLFERVLKSDNIPRIVPERRLFRPTLRMANDSSPEDRQRRRC
jgi:hypothetical protein